MTITPDHWLKGATKSVISGGSEMRIRRLLVVHFTAGASAQSSINFWRTPAARGASAHIVIDRDGTIFQCRPFNRTCGHVGSGRWVDPNTGRKYTSINSIAIGIEIANAGSNPQVIRWARNNDPNFAGTVNLKHRNGGPVKEWEEFPLEQLVAVTELSQTLVQRYRLDDISGHDCLDPEDRNDPGPAFPMKTLRETCGFNGLPVVHFE